MPQSAEQAEGPVFAVVRLDLDMVERFGPSPDFVYIKKFVEMEDVAEREVQRLNDLNGDKGSLYLWLRHPIRSKTVVGGGLRDEARPIATSR